MDLGKRQRDYAYTAIVVSVKQVDKIIRKLQKVEFLQGLNMVTKV